MAAAILVVVAMAFATAAAFFFLAAAAIAAIDEAKLAINGAKGSSRVAFIGVDVHRKGVARRDANDGVVEDRVTPIARADVDRDVIAIGDAEVFGIFRGHVDMAFGDDHTFFEIHFTFRAAEGALARALGIARFANWGGNAQGTGIGEAQFDLVAFADRAKDRKHGARTRAIRVFFVVADHFNAIRRSELARLREHLTDFEGVPFAEEGFQGFLGDVHVTRARLY